MGAFTFKTQVKGADQKDKETNLEAIHSESVLIAGIAHSRHSDAELNTHQQPPDNTRLCKLTRTVMF